MSAMKTLYTLAQEIHQTAAEIEECRMGLQVGGYFDQVAATANLALLNERLFQLNAEFAAYPQTWRIQAMEAFAS